MKRDRFTNWLRNIYETEEEEISCTECFDLVSRFVELEASGENAVVKMPQVKRHLNQCQACRDEYETLRELRRLEDEDRMPSVDDLQDLIP